ncbi:MAG: peptidyl-prolyl cis-trans isomerase [Flavobacteriaceae bacterium]|nr:peptidyl-prolyl cis-trans isomerase [Flavobacteriaceae bacterium]
MKFKILFASLFLSLAVYSQKDSAILFKIDNKPVFVSDFKRVYEKNLDIVSDKDQKAVESYLDLFINYQLKVKEAYSLKLDTVKTYKSEINSYKNQLAKPYLQDSTFIKKLIKDAYQRTKHMLNASHILVKVSPNATPKDTLKAYAKILNAVKEIKNGTSFANVALKYSEDPSVKSNFGNLGNFTAFKMVYSFEKAAYNTKVGELSTPFRTQFGYHIVTVHSKKPSPGEVKIAHIFINKNTIKGKEKIDTVYNQLKLGVAFEKLVKKYSQDRNTIANGGLLPKFGIGRMPTSIEDEAFALKNVNDFSKPFQTRFGWHVIKLIEKYPITSFEKMEKELAKKVKASGGNRLSDLAMKQKLRKKYNTKIYQPAKKVFYQQQIRSAKRDTLTKTLLTIEQKKISQQQFFDFIRNRRHLPIDVLFEDFVDQEVLSYFKENLIHTQPSYAETLKEYQEGLLVFDFMQQKVWNKSVKDSLGLQQFFKANKSTYKFTDLSKNKGTVMNDYQTYLENELIQDLRKKYKVTIRKRTLKKLIKHYKTNG